MFLQVQQSSFVEQAVKFINGELELTTDNKLYYDNTKRKIIK